MLNLAAPQEFYPSVLTRIAFWNGLWPQCRVGVITSGLLATVCVMTCNDRRGVFQIRCNDVELARWRAAAGGLPLAVWVRQACDDRAQLDGALARQDKGSGGGRLESVVVDSKRLMQSPAPRFSPPADPPAVSPVLARALAADLPGVTVASRLPANFCARTGLEKSSCLCPDCKGA